MKSRDVMQMDLLAMMFWKGLINIPTKLENQNYLSQTLLIYLSEDFEKNFKNP